jgi:thymidylate kinase
MKQLKIGFTGTHGTGKTTAALTLAAQLKKEGYDVQVLSNTARSAPPHLPINEKATKESQLWIFSKMLKQELESKAQIIVCDRTLLDVLAYTKNACDITAKHLETFVHKYMTTYSAIFYMYPREAYLKDDGRRSVNLAFQKKIEEIIDHYITSMHLPVKDKTEKERKEEVLSLLRSK